VKPTNWYFEDFYPGQEIALGSRTVSEEEIIAFARQFDPQPFHVDHDAAEASIFKGVIASGWHTCSMMMRLVVDNLMSESSSMGSPGLDSVRWLVPVRAGDTLSVSYLTTRVRPSASRSDRGVVWSKWSAANQHGQVVCTIEGMGMFGRRPAEGADA
jgi:acyl dehydratase